MHRTLLVGRCGHAVVGLVWPAGHVVQTLLDNAAALAHLLGAYAQPVHAVTVPADRNIKLDLVITSVWTRLAQVEIQTGGAQAGPGDAPVDGFVGIVGADTDRALLEHRVFDPGLFVLVQPRCEPVQEFGDFAIPAVGQIHGHAADAEERRVHAEAGHRLDYVIEI